MRACACASACRRSRCEALRVLARACGTTLSVREQVRSRRATTNIKYLSGNGCVKVIIMCAPARMSHDTLNDLGRAQQQATHTKNTHTQAAVRKTNKRARSLDGKTNLSPSAIWCKSISCLLGERVTCRRHCLIHVNTYA